MAIITGPKLDEAKRQLSEWYLRTRASLIEAMEEGGYPYHSRQLSPQEQLQNFLNMGPEDWQFLQTKLMERHRGQPNQRELVEEDIRKYTAQMTRLQYGGRG